MYTFPINSCRLTLASNNLNCGVGLANSVTVLAVVDVAAAVVDSTLGSCSLELRG